MLEFDSHKRLTSLSEMLAKYAGLYSIIEREIADLETWLRDEYSKRPHNTGQVLVHPPQEGSAFVYILGVLKDEALKVNLPSVRAQIDRIESKLKRETWEYNDMLTHVRELRNRLQDDLSTQHFLYVPDEFVAYYDNAGNLFKGQTITRFPEIVDDAEGAGHCLALGEGTACVLHLMRVMEVGLKALSKSLGIPYAPSWESHLTQIERRISEKYKDKTDEWKKDETFYRDVSGDLMTVKQAWRNPTMHVGRKYGREEAREIFNAVRNFMKRLADEMPTTTSSSVVQFSPKP